MMDVQRHLEETRAVRYVEEPTSLPVFRSVTRIWHFTSGDVLLECADHRDCLIPSVEQVDVPVEGIESIILPDEAAKVENIKAAAEQLDLSSLEE